MQENRISTLTRDIAKDWFTKTELKPLKDLISFGNNKLSRDGWGKDIALFNLGSATNCYSNQTGQCTIGKKCYALKAEKQYPRVLNYRKNQLIYWDSVDYLQFYKDFMNIVQNRTIKVKALRFNESGDIRNLDDLVKMSNISELLSFVDIRVYTYTANKNVIDDAFSSKYKWHNNLVVNGSGFMIDNSFTAVKEFPNIPNTKHCLGNCGICTLCMIKGNSNIYIKLH